MAKKEKVVIHDKPVFVKKEVADVVDFLKSEKERLEKIYYNELDAKSANALLVRERLIEIDVILNYIDNAVMKCKLGLPDMYENQWSYAK